MGQTSLVYHLAWAYRRMGFPVLAVDLDPQANLTTMVVDEEVLERLGDPTSTVYTALCPLLEGTGDIQPSPAEEIQPGLGLAAGDLRLAPVEDELSSQWPDSLDRKPRAFRVITAFGA